MNSQRHTRPTLDVVVLAAGESSRLGQPKQHVLLASQSLLERSLKLACDISDALPVPRIPVLVSGAYLQQDCVALAIRRDQRKITHHYNAHWKQGMSTSLDCARPWATADGVLLLLVDQYKVQIDDLMAMHALWLRQPERAVAARYANTLGPPVIWPRHLWAAQSAAKDNHSRLDKSVLKSSDPQLYDMPDAAVDLDTTDDLARALANIVANTARGL